MTAKWCVWILLLPMNLLAQQYTAINLPSSFGTQFIVTGINPSGTDIVGTYYDGTKTSGVELSKGTFSTISFPAGAGQANWTSAAAVNDANTVVGAYFPQIPAPVAPEFGMTYTANKAFISFVAPGPKMTWFTAINNSGSVVGYYQDWGCDGPQCNRRGLLLSNGSFRPLQFPASLNTIATSINGTGEIAGNYEDAVGWHGFTWNKGVYHAFNKVSGATLTGINDSQDVVGVHSSGAFLLSSSGALYAILFPGSTYTSVAGIANRKNNSVEVVGNYVDSNSTEHGFYAVVTLANH